MPRKNTKKKNSFCSKNPTFHRHDNSMCSNEEIYIPPNDEFFEADLASANKISNIEINSKNSFPIKISSTLDSPQSSLDKYLLPEAQKCLLLIVDHVISCYMQRVNENRKLLPKYDPNLPISKFIVDLSRLDPTLINNIVSKKGKSKYQWWGFIYEWVDMWTNVTMTGKTTRPIPIRKWEYIWRAIYIPPHITSLKQKYKNHFYRDINHKIHYDSLNINPEIRNDITEEIIKQIKINGLIFHHLRKTNLIPQNITGLRDISPYDYSLIETAINNRFHFRILELTFSNNSLSACEIRRVHHQQGLGIALNRDDKSSGSNSIHNAIILDILRCVASGLKTKQIHKELLKKGYNLDESTISTTLEDVFGGMRKAQDNLLNSVLDLFFEKYEQHLITIYDFFERGFSSDIIASLSGLDKIFGDSAEIVRRVIKKKYSPHYNNCKSYTRLRAMVFKDLFTKEVKLGKKNYSDLLEKFDGFFDLSDRNKTRRISDYFITVFDGKLLSEILLDLGRENFSENEVVRLNRQIINKKKVKNPNIYQDFINKIDQKELLLKALKLLKIKIWDEGITNYSSNQLCLDLNFGNIFLLTIKNIKSSPKKLIKEFMGKSFHELIVQALNLRDKAIHLVYDHIDEIATTSGVFGYNCINLLTDLGFDRFYTNNTLKTKHKQIINKFLGFSSFQGIIDVVIEDPLYEVFDFTDISSDFYVKNVQEIYAESLKLVRYNIIEKTTRYNSLLLCKDLASKGKLHGFSNRTVKSDADYIIQTLFKMSFDQFRIKALNFREKALILIRKHINEIGTILPSGQRRGATYKKSDLLLDLGFDEFLSKKNIISESNPKFERYIGLTFDELVEIVKNN
jgi:hypothetical protein